MTKSTDEKRELVRALKAREREAAEKALPAPKEILLKLLTTWTRSSLTRVATIRFDLRSLGRRLRGLIANGSRRGHVRTAVSAIAKSWRMLRATIPRSAESNARSEG
jgi:hypothetical protein